jgi:hypothetical protein
MSPTSTYLVAHERINDLLREAEQARQAGELTSTCGQGPAAPGPARPRACPPAR